MCGKGRRGGSGRYVGNGVKRADGKGRRKNGFAKFLVRKKSESILFNFLSFALFYSLLTYYFFLTPTQPTLAIVTANDFIYDCVTTIDDVKRSTVCMFCASRL